MWPRADLHDAARRGTAGTRLSVACSAPGAAGTCGSAPAACTVDRPLAAVHRLVEAERERLVQIGAALGRRLCRASLALAQDVGEQIAEGGRRRAADARPRSRTPRSRRVGRSAVDAADADRVVPPPPVRIAQRLVRLGDLPELRRRRAVTRIDVRVIPPRQPPVRALDVAQRRAPARGRGGRRSPCNRRFSLLRSFVHHLRVDDVALRLAAARGRPRRPAPAAARRRAARRPRLRLLVQRLGRLVLRRGQLVERALHRRRVGALARLLRRPPSPPRSPAGRRRQLVAGVLQHPLGARTPPGRPGCASRSPRVRFLSSSACDSASASSARPRPC